MDHKELWKAWSAWRRKRDDGTGERSRESTGLEILRRGEVWVQSMGI
jgi:hypothetical protein